MTGSNCAIRFGVSRCRWASCTSYNVLSAFGFPFVGHGSFQEYRSRLFRCQPDLGLAAAAPPRCAPNSGSASRMARNDSHAHWIPDFSWLAASSNASAVGSVTCRRVRRIVSTTRTGWSAVDAPVACKPLARFRLFPFILNPDQFFYSLGASPGIAAQRVASRDNATFGDGSDSSVFGLVGIEASGRGSRLRAVEAGRCRTLGAAAARSGFPLRLSRRRHRSASLSFGTHVRGIDSA